MSTGTNNTPRILAAAKEFNIGKDTLIEFLKGKGFEIDAKPSTKLSEQMYNALQSEFAKDKAVKQKSESIELPKGSLMDSLNKTQEELDITSKDIRATSKLNTVKETKPRATAGKVGSNVEPQSVKPAATTPTEPTVEKQAPVATPAAPKVEAVKEEPKKVVEKPTTPDVTPVKPSETKEAPVAKPAEEVKAPVVPASEKEMPAPKKEIEKPTTTVANDTKEDASSPEHIETKSHKLTGPKVLDKINLDDLNLSTRPKKGQSNNNNNKKKEEVKKSEPKTTTSTSDSVKSSSSPSVPVKETPIAKENTAAVNAPVQPKEVVKPVTPVVPSTPAEPAKPEHIEMNAPRLAGPKILGKIELPVSNSGRDSRNNKSNNNNNNNKQRKRIPLDGAKKEGNNNNNNNPNNRRDRNDNNNNNRNNNNNNGGGNNVNRNNNNNNNRNNNPQGGNNNNRPAGQNRDNNRGPNQRGGDRNFGPRGDRNNRNNPRGAAQNQPQEVDAKAIQDKIRETQAKLAGGGAKNKNLKAKYRRNKREEMAEKRAQELADNDNNVIQVTEFISVSELANLLEVNFAEVISKCMGLGIMVSINQRLDAEVIELVASEFDKEVEFINLQQDTEEEEETQDDLEDTTERAPVVTIMGHVDHGKTSLLDYIRNASVVAGEAGGITQHIGAYRVTTDSGKNITFLDTPGHEAFTAMRARGAKAADVAVIVIAADDAIMPQTKEAISHAQAAGLPMVFAINKIDKEGANPEKIREQLAQMNILVEDWGGKYQCQEISAKKGISVDVLLEKILLEAELLELKANPDKAGIGSVIEASLDKGRGYVSTILVQNGTLRMGEMIVSGQYFGKVKAMFNERGQRVKEAGPSTPVQVLGLNGAPQAGEKFKVYVDESEAKNVANRRSQILREQGIRARKHITLDEIGRRLALGNFKELNVIIKGDVDGSVEALSDSLQKLSTDEVVVNVVHKAVGQITESDVLLASASDAIILGFQVRPSMQASRLADNENIEIRYYSIIYDAIDEIKSAMEGLLEPTIEKKIVGNIEIRETFKISGVGTIAGCYVLDGKFTRNTKVNIIRDGIVVHHGELASLKRFKDDVKEVVGGYECGLSIKNYNDIRVNDIIEGYEEVEVKRKL